MDAQRSIWIIIFFFFERVIEFFFVVFDTKFRYLLRINDTYEVVERLLLNVCQQEFCLEKAINLSADKFNLQSSSLILCLNFYLILPII